MKTNGAHDGLLTAAQAADLLGIKESTIRRWTHERRIPVVKPFGRLARYRRADLEALIAKSVKPALRALSE